jgi:hypothetical protein
MVARNQTPLFIAGAGVFRRAFVVSRWPKSNPGEWNDAHMGYYRSSGNAKYSAVPFHSAPGGVTTVRREVTTFEIGLLRT